MRKDSSVKVHILFCYAHPIATYPNHCPYITLLDSLSINARDCIELQAAKISFRRCQEKKMNRNETEELYRKGMMAWNDWAKTMLESRDKCENWREAATANFANATFSQDADFTDFIFPSDAKFTRAVFSVPTSFENAKFQQEVIFISAVMYEITIFDKATFVGDAYFDEAIFKEHVSFQSVTFKSKAIFRAIEAKRIFNLTETYFQQVPNFTQGTFTEVPLFDTITIAQEKRKGEIWQCNKQKVQNDFESIDLYPGYWKVLKHLAAQGHDFESEQRFFRMEIITHRAFKDGPRNASFWASLLYQTCSNFGQSLSRPLIGFCLIFSVSAVFNYLYSNTFTVITHGQKICGVDISDDLWYAAIAIATNKSIPGFFAFRDKLPEFHARLYGAYGDHVCQPNVPDMVSTFGVIQSVSSAAFIFLFLLAVRNRFRIK